MSAPDADRAASAAAQRWAEVRATAEAALALSSDARAAFLDRACGDDASLRTEVDAHLDACERATRSSAFLAEPAAAFVAPLFEGLMTAEAALRAALKGRYDIERELGRGGMATVYLARDVRHARRVAVKVLEPVIGAAMSAERFLREIRVTAGLTHPHILPLYESGEAGGMLYYVMPYIEGETLRARLSREGALPVADAVRVIRELADALAYAHTRAVVHRDLKPENVLLSGGHAVIADFGIAKALAVATESTSATDATVARGLTSVGVALGTPAYMAPEQAVGDAATDHRADLYALGVVAYEMLVGAHPFGIRTPQELVTAHLTETPPPPGTRRADVPRELGALVMRLLAKRPADRPSSADEVLVALDSASAPSSADSLSRPTRRSRASANARVAVLAALVLLTATVAGYAGWGRAVGRAKESPPAAGTAAVDVGRGTNDAEAYELYLKGRYYWHERGAENVARSIAYFQQAIARDPTYARAYAGLALAYNVLGVYVADPSDTTTPLIQASARRAMTLDSTIADAQLAAAFSAERDFRFVEAEAHYRAALRLEPPNAYAHHAFGAMLMSVGRTDEAIVELREARRLDPLAKSAGTMLAEAFIDARRFGDAKQEARRILAIEPDFPLALYSLGLAQVFDGQADSAVGTLERGVRLYPQVGMKGRLLFAYAAAGRRADVERIRSELRQPGVDRTGGAMPAFADFVLGDHEPLIRLVTTSSGQRLFSRMLRPTFNAPGCNPLADPLWSDTAYREAMRRIGMASCPGARPWPLPPRPRA